GLFLAACCRGGGYLRQQVLNTTADELRGLDGALAETASRSLQGIDPILARFADKLRASADLPALENAAVLQQLVEHSGQIDAIALIGRDGKVLRTIGAWPADLTEIADKNLGGGPPSSRARIASAPVEDP